MSSSADDGPPDVGHVTASGDAEATASVEVADPSIDGEHHMEVESAIEDQLNAPVEEPEKQAEPEAELLPEPVPTEKLDETEADKVESETVPTEKSVETELLAAESIVEDLPEQSEPESVQEPDTEHAGEADDESAPKAVQAEEKADESEPVPAESIAELYEPAPAEEKSEDVTATEKVQEPEATSDEPEAAKAVTSEEYENVGESVEELNQNEPAKTSSSVEKPCEDVSMTEGVDESVSDVEMPKTVDSGDAKKTTDTVETMTHEEKTSTDVEMSTEEPRASKDDENPEKLADVETQEKSAQNEETSTNEGNIDKVTTADKIPEESTDTETQEKSTNDEGQSNVESSSDAVDKSASGGESVIEISAVSGNVDVDMADETSKDADGGLKIASVTSGSVPDDEVIQILDDGNDKDKTDVRFIFILKKIDKS